MFWCNCLQEIFFTSGPSVRFSLFEDIIWEDDPHLQRWPLKVEANSIQEFLAADWSLCVEAAGQPWVREYGKSVLSQGRDLLVTSVGVFTDDQFLEDLTNIARTSNARLLLPAGAMPGLDWMSSAALDEIDEITLEQRKRPEGWVGTPAEEHLDLSNLTQEATVFQGTARVAANQFPKNANIAAALALGTVGLDKLQVRLVADPNVPGPTNKVSLRGKCGELSLEVRGKPLSQRTSRIVPFSVLKALKNLSSPLSIGLWTGWAFVEKLGMARLT